MIASLNGRLIFKSPTEVIVECAGVGYSASISVKCSENLPDKGSIVNLSTMLIPRDDSLNLYGFIDSGEKEMFKSLISVSGIGPKMAIGILSAITVEELRETLLGGNLPALKKLPGVGKKTAERLLVELKDKMLSLGYSGIESVAGLNRMIHDEAISALVTLGYARSVAEKSVAMALKYKDSGDIDSESLIKESLKIAMK